MEKILLKPREHSTLVELYYKDRKGRWILYGGVKRQVLELLAEDPSVLTTYLRKEPRGTSKI